MPLELNVTKTDDNGKRISLSGSLDTDTAPQLQTEIDLSVDESTTTLILDMRELKFLSSAGLRVIFKTKKSMDSCQGKLLLLNLQPQVRKVFEIIKAVEHMEIFQNEQDLDDYLAAMQQKVLDND